MRSATYALPDMRWSLQALPAGVVAAESAEPARVAGNVAVLAVAEGGRGWVEPESSGRAREEREEREERAKLVAAPPAIP